MTLTVHDNSTCENCQIIPVVRGALLYTNITNPRALCNDFTRAGLFKQTFLSSKKWLIFFESGGFCYSAESCNQRFFHPSLRTNSALDNELSDEEFDPVKIWETNKNRDLSYVVSPLMTSVHRFRNRKELFPLGGLIVDGTDILSRNCVENPKFCEFNFVLVPYCSSDLWLGNDTRDFGGESESFFYSNHYKPNSQSLQFLFRGAVIFRAAIEDLLPSFGEMTEEIVVAGSSAGGVGVLNHMSWLKDYLKQHSVSAELSVVADSSWFINFQGDLEKLFTTESPSSTDALATESSTKETLVDLISWHKPCVDMRSSRIPCCVAAHCILSNPDYFPDDIPVFAVVSLYDVFILGASLSGLVILANENQAVEAGYALDFVRIIAEYGGEMNRSITELTQERKFVSTFVTGCFQHIYFATSSLWGEAESSLFGTSLVEFASSFAAIRHSIRARVWSDFKLNQSSGSKTSIKEAIEEWYAVKSNTTLHYRDGCQGPHCNDACPEMFILDDLVSDIWRTSAKGFLIFIVVGVAFCCLVIKVIFALWLWKLEWRQQLYLGLLGDESRTCDIETALQFPDCSENDAVSIACLDLSYKIKISQQIKDERQDNITPLVLAELSTTEEDMELSDIEEEEEDKEACGSEMGVSVGREEAEEDLKGSNDRRPSKHELLKRVRTRKTLRATYQNYGSGGEISDSGGTGQPEAFKRIKTIAQRTLRGSRRLKNQQSTIFESSMSPGVMSPNIVLKSPEPFVCDAEDDINSSTRNYYDSQDSHYAKIVDFDKSEGQTSGNLDLFSTETNQSLSVKKRAHLRTNLKGLLEQQRASMSIKYGARKYKEILKGISLYFNPGELIGIMGPSGCGKTTFLDLLTGRRTTGAVKGHIYVNGTKMKEVRDWYVSNTGYVLQLANPYYEELTVRQNLTLAAQIKLSDHYTLREKFQRVEQVMFVSGLLEFADTTVGGSTGPGLSGGQKRRLAVALQLLKLPNVIFLDEPTSGLDAASSFELLTHLNKLADSNRTIILTIHQPRLEIFHMFTRLVLFCDGKVAYHGVPDKAYEVFVSALKSRYLEQGIIIPELEDHNPADVIMDILGNSRMRQIITDYYQASDEPRYVRQAINAVTVNEVKKKGTFARNLTRHFSYAMYGARKVQHKHAGTFSRLAALEARASRRMSWLQGLYLPIIFFAYGILLGTAYFQQDAPLLVMSGFCVYSVASALFMFPILFNYYSRALQVYTYEHGDGVGNAFDLIIQGFIHAVSMSIFPVILCAGILYLLLVNTSSYNGPIFGQLVVVNLVLNQCWTALLIALICAFPMRAFRLSPVISSVAGFTSGFFIPIQEMHWGYRWLFYINPNYYGFSASAYLLLADFKTSCVGSEFECYTSSGEYILRQFSFHNINPYLHILILLIFTGFFLILAVFCHWLHHSNIATDLARVRMLVKPSFWPGSTLSTPSEDTIIDDDDDDDNDEDEDDDDDVIFVDDDIKKMDESVFEGKDKEKLETTTSSGQSVNPIDLVAESQGSMREFSKPTEEGKDSEIEKAANLSTILEEHSNDQGKSQEIRKVRLSDLPLPRSRAMTDVTSSRPITLTKISSDSRIKDHRITHTQSGGLVKGHQDFFQTMEPTTAPRHRSGTTPWKPSVFLNPGEQHKVWRPMPSVMSPQSATSQSHPSKLLPQKSRPQLLANRKKILDNRLLATREALKMQNLEGAQQLSGSVSSGATALPRPSFSDVSKRVKSNIAKKKRKEAQQFYNIVDKYVAMMSNEAKPLSTPTSLSLGGGTQDSPSSGRYHPLAFKYSFSPQSGATTPTTPTTVSHQGKGSPPTRTTASPLPRRRQQSPCIQSVEVLPVAFKHKPGLSKTESPMLRVQSAGAMSNLPPVDERGSMDTAVCSLPV